MMILNVWWSWYDDDDDDECDDDDNKVLFTNALKNKTRTGIIFEFCIYFELC